jgi:hypothetical protein
MVHANTTIELPVQLKTGYLSFFELVLNTLSPGTGASLMFGRSTPELTAVTYFVDKTGALLWSDSEEEKKAHGDAYQYDPNTSERMRGLASSYLSLLLRLYFVDKDNASPAKAADAGDSDADEDEDGVNDLHTLAHRSKQEWQQSIESVVLPLLEALPTLIDTIEGADAAARQTKEFHADCGRTVAALKLLTFDEVLYVCVHMRVWIIPCI